MKSILAVIHTSIYHLSCTLTSLFLQPSRRLPHPIIPATRQWGSRLSCRSASIF